MLGMNLVAGKWSSYTVRKNGLTVRTILSSPPPPVTSSPTDQGLVWQAWLLRTCELLVRQQDFTEANLRRDGSHKFPTDLQWKWFPSFSAGWIFTNESFLEPVKPVLSFGKIRASWGSVGDQSVSSNLYKSILAGGQSSWIGGNGQRPTKYDTPSLVDSDITWQMIETLDFGTDLRFWDNRIGLTFDGTAGTPRI